MTTSNRKNAPVKIIGIGGLPRSGKDTLAEMFVDAGYYGVSLGDINRDHTRERHKDDPNPISVENMTETSNWLRQQHGPDVLLKDALKRYEVASEENDYQGIALYSIRAPIEVDFILDQGGEIIWVEADDVVRHNRAMLNRREGEAEIDLEEFKRQENLQWQPQPGLDPTVQMNTQYVKQKATKTLVNNGNDIQDFRAKAKALIESVS
jgi:dephospho-CoA kinase